MPIARFGQFEVDLETGELSNQGRRLLLQTKPFQLLAALLERPGQLVTREDLRRKIWPAGTYLDFGRSLNIAVAKLRRTLSDSADKPIFVETLFKRGYRFTAPVEIKGQQRQLVLRSRGEVPQRRVRIAVLPFESYCDTEEQAQFSEDLTHKIRTQLGQVYPRYLAIVPIERNFQYQTESRSIPEIGRDLKVDHVLGGSVRIAAGRVQVAAQLTPVTEQAASWAERYSYAATDLVKVRVEAATRISRALASELVPSPPEIVSEQATSDDAYLEYLKGQQCHSRFTSMGFRKSIQHFERAIFLDPNYASAYSSLACSKAGLGSVVFSGGRPKDFYPQAKEAALRALEINNKISNCHTALAIVKMYYEWDWSAGERLLFRALELDPSESFAHQVYSRLLASMRRHDEAIDEAKLICELQPLSAQAYYLLGEAYFGARQYDRALTSFQEALDLDEMHGAARMGAGIVYSQMAMFTEAISELELASTIHADNTTILASLGETYARAGQLEKARTVLNKLTVISNHQYVSPFDFALITTGFGRKDKAIEYLQRAYKESCPLLVKFLLPENPRFDTLRDDRRYSDLVKRIREHSPKFGIANGHIGK